MFSNELAIFWPFIDLGCKMMKRVDWSLPPRYSEGPGHKFSLCPVSLALPGPHMSWVLAPVPFAPQHLEPTWSPNVPSNSVRCPDSLLPYHCPLLYQFCHLPPDTPAGGLAPVLIEWPQSHGQRSLGYSGGQRQGSSDYPESSGCLWTKQRTR